MPSSGQRPVGPQPIPAAHDTSTIRASQWPAGGVLHRRTGPRRERALAGR